MNEMSHRERFLAAINHQEPDSVPIDCTFTIGAYTSLAKHLGLDDGPLHPNQWMEIRPSPAMAEALDLDACYLDTGRPSGAPIFEFGMNRFVDEWGIGFKKADLIDGYTYYDPIEPPLANATLDDLDDYPWPDPYDRGWMDGFRERAKSLRENWDRAVILELPVSIFEHAYMLRGMEQFMLDLSINPTFTDAVMGHLCDIAIGVACASIREAGQYIDVVKHLDDQGGQLNTLLSPKMFRKSILPHFSRMYKAIKDEFAAYNPEGKIMTHTDGAVYPIIGDYIEAGIDILNPIQPGVPGMEHRRLKQDFGERVAFHGGLDIQHTMPQGTPQEVADEVRQRIKDLGHGGGYILAPSHNLQHDVPPENVIAFRDAARQYGHYPLNL